LFKDTGTILADYLSLSIPPSQELNPDSEMRSENLEEIEHSNILPATATRK